MTTPDDWRRLSPRMLLIEPLNVLRGFLVPLIALAVGISASDRPWLLLVAAPVAVLGAVLLGALPWLTTGFRLDEHQFQQRSGLLNKKVATAPLERVRSVDLEAKLLHRLLGLRKVEIGTGVDDERIVLDAVTVEQAAELRSRLLTRTAAVRAAAGPAAERSAEQVDGTAPGQHADPYAEAAPPSENEEVLSTLDLSWVRFAPFSLARLVIVAGAVGFLSQFGDDLPFLDQEHLSGFWRWVTGFAFALVALVVFLGGLVTWTVIAIAGYLAQWWGLRLVRGHGSLHLTSGLFTTRSVSLEEERVRGVELKEPVLLRVVGGAELSTLSTGVANGTTSILPPCPAAVATSVGAQIVEDDRPLHAGLRQHGSAARRRAHVRGQWLTLTLAAALVAIATLGFLEPVGDWLPGWVPVVVLAASAGLGAVLAEASYAHLGHALTPRHLVVGSGASTRVRTVLEHDGIIGWVVQQSFFQRRAGLATLIATTAAGSESVTLRDVPHEWALGLADTATPGVLTPFVA